MTTLAPAHTPDCSALAHAAYCRTRTGAECDCYLYRHDLSGEGRARADLARAEAEHAREVARLTTALGDSRAIADRLIEERDVERDTTAEYLTVADAEREMRENAERARDVAHTELVRVTALQNQEVARLRAEWAATAARLTAERDSARAAWDIYTSFSRGIVATLREERDAALAKVGHLVVEQGSLKDQVRDWAKEAMEARLGVGKAANASRQRGAKEMRDRIAQAIERAAAEWRESGESGEVTADALDYRASVVRALPTEVPYGRCLTGCGRPARDDEEACDECIINALRHERDALKAAVREWCQEAMALRAEVKRLERLAAGPTVTP